MKKYIIIGGSGVLLILAIWWILGQVSLQEQKSEILGGLPTYIGAFYSQKGRLPFSWEEFVVWSQKSHMAADWHSDDLSRHFALKWGAHISLNNPGTEKLFIVLDPRFKRDYALDATRLAGQNAGCSRYFGGLL